MRILILSWYFPPANDVAALRVGKLAEFLRDSGHDVWVITGERDHPDQSLSTSLAPERIVRTPWFDVNHWRFSSSHPRKARKAAPALGAPEAIAPPPAKRRMSATLGDLYLHMAQIPDRQIGWLPYLLRAGKTLLSAQHFDLIYASGPPFTAFVAAKSLSRRFSIPWVAEYRDGWSRYVYTPKPAWRQAIDEVIENRVTPTAGAIVTVSEPWAVYYRERFALPAAAILNGFDPEHIPASAQRTAARGEPLSIVYLGGLYQGMRDPSVLYDAIRRSGLKPSELQIAYYGPKAADVYPLTEKFGVTEFVVINPQVPYRRSLEIQRASDVLLLLQSPHDPRNVPAKIFEYLASCRPILGLGLDEGVPARLVRDRNAGLYNTDADAVAAQLKRWVALKTETGIIPDLPESVHHGLSRAEQFRALELFFRSLLDRQPRQGPVPTHSHR